MSSIAAWAAAVRPGSPAPPSPCSFLLPTPSHKTVDLTNLGYNNVFIHIPNTPSSSRWMVPASSKQQLRSKPSILGRLRSLTNIRPRSKSVTCAGASSKKAKYARVPPPSSFANDLAVMQFAEGSSSIDTHANRVMKAPGAASRARVDVVYKDENDHLWRDEDENYDRTHLLEGEDVDMYNYNGNEEVGSWARFGSCRDSPSQQRSAPLVDMIIGRPSSELDRRKSLSTRGFQLGARNIAEDAGHQVVPGLSLLSVPSRARKAAGGAVKHPRKPEFLVDVAPMGPRSPSIGKTFVDATSASRPKCKPRRRPPPLKIPSSASSSTKPSNPALPSASFPSTGSLRREFLENSFEPIPQVLSSRVTMSLAGIAGPCQSHLRAADDHCTEMPFRLNLRAVFGLGMSNMS